MSIPLAAGVSSNAHDKSSGDVTLETVTPLALDPVPPVAWDDKSEKRNPINWSMGKRIFTTCIPCVISFDVTFSTSVTVPAAGIIADEFNVSRTESLLPLTLYTLGLAFGPLFIAPFSEVFGRRNIYIFTFACLLLFTGAGSAATTFPALLVCHFLAGFLGSLSMAMDAGTVADIWSLQKAGGTVGLFFILGPFLGPVLGPLAGTYILKDHGNDWRWTQWLILILGAPAFLATLFMKETSKIYILRSDDRFDSSTATAAKLTTLKVKFAILRAARMLFTDITVFSLTLYTAYAYAYALIFSYFAIIPYVFPLYYAFDAQASSLVFLSIMIGYFLAIGLFAFFDRTLYARARKAAGGGLPALENRLYSALVGSIFLPIGLSDGRFAWAGHVGGNWAVLAASGIPFGLGAFSLFLSTINYLVDTYQSSAAASALAANGSLRFTLGAVIPLFTEQMFARLGIHWAGSVFAFFSIALLPIPWLLLRYGHRLRKKSDPVGGRA